MRWQGWYVTQFCPLGHKDRKCCCAGSGLLVPEQEKEALASLRLQEAVTAPQDHTKLLSASGLLGKRINDINVWVSWKRRKRPRELWEKPDKQNTCFLCSLNKCLFVLFCFKCGNKWTLLPWARMSFCWKVHPHGLLENPGYFRAITTESDKRFKGLQHRTETVQKDKLFTLASKILCSVSNLEYSFLPTRDFLTACIKIHRALTIFQMAGSRSYCNSIKLTRVKAHVYSYQGTLYTLYVVPQAHVKNLLSIWQ